MELLWFFNPSLGADYGQYNCQVCRREFYYSPRLECHCNSCAIKELRWMLQQEKDAGMRLELSENLSLLEAQAAG